MRLRERLARAELRRRAGRRRQGAAWRIATPVVFVAAGVLLVTSAINAEGTDLRAGRYDDLADLAREEGQQVQDLRAEISDLNAQVDRLTKGLGSSDLDQLQARVEALQVSAGVKAAEGPGVTVTLDDAPADVLNSAGDQVSNALVHQQDIQAVANALWAGGAEAMTIQGQRVISTTGIKCIGNTVRLQDVPYSPPYVISAIGNPDALLASIDANPYIDRYLQAVDEWQLGWSVKTEDRIVAPEYSGPLELRYATAVHKQPRTG